MSDPTANQPVVVTGDQAESAATIELDQFGDLAGVGAILQARRADEAAQQAADDGGDDRAELAPSDSADAGGAPSPTDPSGDAPTGATTASAPVADDASQVESTPFTVTLPDGSTHDITQDDALRLLGLEGWARNLPPETREAFAAIEARQAAAVPLADFEQFQAWRLTQQRTQQEAQLASALDNIDDLADPETVAAVRAMQQSNAQLQADLQRANAALAGNQAQNINASVQGVRGEFEQGVAEWAAERGIEDEAILDRLFTAAVDARVIPSLVQGATLYNPATGMVARQADMGVVARRAMDFALISDPELHTSVLSGGGDARGGAPATPGTDTPGNVVALKRSRSSSLASAPSASVPNAPTNPVSMSHPDYIDGMAKFIAQSRGTGT